MAKHNELGALGEDIAAEYLQGKGMTVIERNFRRPYGEIDIIARATRRLLVFVEVKSVSYEMGRGDPNRVSYETHRPEENIHPQKLRRLSRTIEAYLLSKRYDGDWRFDVVAVFIDPKSWEARIRHTEDVIIGA
jgi:putative endonuclease